MATLQVPEDSGYDEWENNLYDQAIEDWENRDQWGIEW